MFETHLDATYAWIGLALASVATAGVVAAIPASPPPDANGVTHTIDSVAGGEFVATAEHGLAADRLRITPRTIELASGETVARSTIDAGPVTPVPSPASDSDDRLRKVLHGVPPETVFDEPADLAAAAERERASEHEWRTAPDRVTVKRVRHGDIHVTLVG